jgi:hypothetical protein
MYYRFLFLLFLTGCTTLVVKQFDAEYGLAQMQDRIIDPNYLELNLLKSIPHEAISILPELILVRVTTLDEREDFYTLINNRGYSNVTSY